MFSDFKPVLRIRIRSDPELFGRIRIRAFGTGSGAESEAIKIVIFVYPFCAEKLYEYLKILFVNFYFIKKH
jgi:hypothetical protein